MAEGIDKLRYHVIVQVMGMRPVTLAGTNDEVFAYTLYAIRLDHWGNKNGVLWLKDTKVGVHQPILAESRPYQ